MQKYVYYGTDQTEVYWVHFTGSNVKNILKEYHLFESGRIMQTGNSTEYHQLFRKMIQELQLTRPHYEEYLSLLLRELFLLISRQTPIGISSQNRMLQKEMEEATQYFSEHFTEEISIEQYAMDKHLSTSWFIRSFKRYNGVTPMQYILNLRITNAPPRILLLRLRQLLGMITHYISADCSKSKRDSHHLSSGIQTQRFSYKININSIKPPTGGLFVF